MQLVQRVARTRLVRQGVAILLLAVQVAEHAGEGGGQLGCWGKADAVAVLRQYECLQASQVGEGPVDLHSRPQVAAVAEAAQAAGQGTQSAAEWQLQAAQVELHICRSGTGCDCRHAQRGTLCRHAALHGIAAFNLQAQAPHMGACPLHKPVAERPQAAHDVVGCSSSQPPLFYVYLQAGQQLW